MRIIFSCGHSGKACGASVTTTKGRSAPVALKPITRIDGLDVRYTKATSDNSVPSRIASSSRTVNVANRVAAAMPKSCRLWRHRRCQAGRSNSCQATSISNPATPASGISASKGALKASSASSHSDANTAASGVRAPASRLGSERFSEPQAT